MSFVVPIAIASFFGSIFSGPTAGARARVGIVIVDEDASPITTSIVAGVAADKTLAVTKTTAEDARERVRKGRTGVAIIIPKGFGDAANRAFFSGREKPQLDILFGPSHTAEVAMVRGITIPYTVREQAMTSGDNVPYNGYAHSFAGMGIQFLLFAATNLGIEVLLERQRGLWKRLRSAPVSRGTLLGGKAVSATLIALMTLLVSFAFAMVVFKVRIQGSVPGFFAVATACSWPRSVGRRGLPGASRFWPT